MNEIMCILVYKASIKQLLITIPDIPGGPSPQFRSWVGVALGEIRTIHHIG